MSEQQTPAGWYMDPSGSNNMRYWDGTQWTEHTGAAPPQQSFDQQVNQTVDSVANAFQNTEGSELVVLSAPYAEALDATVGVLPTIGMSVKHVDQQNGVVMASTGMSLTSWGEDITVRLGAGEHEGTTNLWMESKMKFGLVSWGKHKKNFQTIANAVQARLAGGGAPIQSHQVQTPPPGAQPPPPGQAPPA